MCVKDTGTKYQLWISDFNIDGTFTRVHPFIISHTKTIENIEVADDNARKNKNKKYGINKHDTLYIDLIIFLLILKSLNMIGVFMLKIEKKKLNLKHNIL